MVRGIDAAASGMIAMQNLNDIIANNLANVNTPGFKQTIATFKNLHDMEVSKIDAKRGFLNDEKIGSLSAGTVMDSTVFDFKQGSLKITDNPLDAAIKGDGFFVVRTPQGDAYTRNGNFTKGDNNVLTTQEGYPVIGKSGNPITANVNEFDVKSIKIYPNGNVEINNEVVDAIRIVDFNDKKNMEHLGNSLFRPLNNQVPVDSNNFEVTQGAIELSNANVVESMVNTINAMRSYETMAKMVETESRSIAKTVGEVGRLKR